MHDLCHVPSLQSQKKKAAARGQKKPVPLTQGPGRGSRGGRPPAALPAPKPKDPPRGQADKRGTLKSRDLSPEGYVPTFTSARAKTPPKRGRRARQRSPSPVHKRSASPEFKLSPTPERRRTPTPVRRHSPSPFRLRSPTPPKHQPKSPSPVIFSLDSINDKRHRSPSPVMFSLDGSSKSRDNKASKSIASRGSLHHRGVSDDPFALSVCPQTQLNWFGFWLEK